MIDKSSIEQLKNSIDIVDVIGNYIELKKAGANYKALCPFHNEDTPSFVVSPSKQIFHCFGCGAGGDAIKFVMQYENLSYPEAIEKLASMHNFSLQYTKSKSDIKPLITALQQINSFYKKNLFTHQKALAYLQSRGVTNASIEKFELGYAPSSQEQIEYLKANFIPLQDAIDAGVLAKDQTRVYARMIERITFPIFSQNGAIIGFGGRTISNHPAKYLNSPETKLFHKSKILYGYSHAKEAIFQKKRIIVCEGYLDVVMLHQAGFNTAVATLGTALTVGHLPLLRRGEPQVILAYDADKAGITAATKAARLLSSNDIEGGVVIFPEGLDPADMVKNGQIAELEQLFSHPTPFIEFILQSIVKSYNIKDPKQKQNALYEGVAFLRTLPDLIAQEYKNYLAALLDILPSKVPLQTKKNQNIQEDIQTKDTKELSIIKTILLHPDLIDTVLDIIEPHHFVYHRSEFEAAIAQDMDNPQLRAILLDDDILPFKEHHLTSELLVFLIKFYEKRIQQITKEQISFTQKSFLIRKYKEYIRKLRQGELVIE
ncbi:DNA primase [Nitratiruptor sp. YY08-26]|uniref:DNA primase n=1 Tax=unclassified Nitratiruptor TaxID=2624044 RepID=UPI00191554D0|nr:MULTISPECIES: DNA primase [unclassified Nitratiruptor]BCD61402.1 DNA primase [Nitratiruptor sp. YY08-13]BCD65336.1 DNA primase [Nitratiruptor sp. YY08-26]